MDGLSDWIAVQRALGTVRRAAGPGYSTNLYATREQIERWCEVSPLGTLYAKGAVLLLRPDRDFHHVYHVAESASALTQALDLLPAGIYTTDLVGRSDSLQAVCAAYARAGFKDHAFLVRMSRQQGGAAADGTSAIVAAPDDAAAAAAFLERLLDRFTEQLPEVSELRTAASNGHLLLVRRDTGIAGILMYDVKGGLAHLRFWHVDHDARGAGIGRQLMNSFLARCDGMRRITLWVIGDNDRSIAIYQHYGFLGDGLLDRILIAHKETQHEPSTFDPVSRPPGTGYHRVERLF